jgi:hypothetical protein
MSDRIAKKATKKKFHFPKSADGEMGNEKGAEAVVTADAKKPTRSAKKVPEQQPVGASDAVASEAVASEAVASEAVASEAVATRSEAATSKVKRTKKEKVVRDSFTMPKSDYEKIAELKQKCLTAGVSVKKSEILRAGLLLLEAAAPKRLLAAVEQVKTGRPAKS